MYLYYIQAGRTGPIKIGVAGNVQRRLESLRVGNPVILYIRHLVKCKSRANAYFQESEVHKRHKKQKIRGEWFYPEVLDNRIEIIEEGLDIKHLTRLNRLALIDPL